MYTVQPAFARASAQPLPMPRLAPVTKATQPSSLGCPEGVASETMLADLASTVRVDLLFLGQDPAKPGGSERQQTVAAPRRNTRTGGLGKLFRLAAPMGQVTSSRKMP
mmetsp:Transcript_43406/g.114323  ORF Transcript_43406/g.114323 Transcript_43406/m.114323 type:complete len:108 (-) Transcript_43406:3-326(-)